MGRPRKPTRMLELSGAFDKNPQRRRAREGEPRVDKPLGPPPAYLDASEKERWDDVAKMGPWLTASDRLPTEIVARLWARVVRREANPAEYKILESTAAHLGLNPVDRTKVLQPVATPKSKVEKYAS